MNNCLKHLPICKAECCKQFSFVLPKGFKFPKIEKLMVVEKKLTKDQAHYFQLHGCKYKRGLLILNIQDYTLIENTIIIKNRCKALTSDLLCSLHGTDEQPEICFKPNAKDHENLENARITDNCLYKK